MGQALERRYHGHRRQRYYVDPDVAMLPIDALGFRRGAGALKTLLQDQGLADHPLFAQAKARGIKALAGHAESIDVTNDVNGGPSGVGIATAAGKAAFWDVVGASMDAPEDHRVRRRVRDDRRSRAGAEDAGAGAEGRQAAPRDDLRQQRRHRRFADRRRHRPASTTATAWSSSGRRTAGTSSPSTTATTTTRWWRRSRRWRTGIPRIAGRWSLIGKTTKGYWPAAVSGKIPGHGNQVVGYPSHPYAMKMNSEYFVALARTFEQRYGVAVPGHPRRPVKDTARAADAVQDQHRRRDVGARQERPRRLAGRSARRDRRLACATICRCAST